MHGHSADILPALAVPKHLPCSPLLCDKLPSLLLSQKLSSAAISDLYLGRAGPVVLISPHGRFQCEKRLCLGLCWQTR